MPFLDKDKVAVTLVLQKDVMMAGETLSGNMNVVVLEAVRCTALRVQIKGQEMVYVRKNSDANPVGHIGMNTADSYDRSYDDIVERTATVLGEQRGRGGRGSIELDPGNYSYPFSIVMPTDLPPTYAIQEFNYGGTITYTLKAIVDIPMGLDNVVEWPITVVRNAPLSQVYEARAAPAVVHPIRSDIATCGCAGCYCNHEDDSYILTTALIAPYVAVVSTNAAAHFAPSTAAVAPLPPPEKKSVSDDFGQQQQQQQQPPMAISGDPSVITLRVLVENHTKGSTIPSARVKLTQLLRYWNSREHPIKLFDQIIVFQHGPLQPGQSTAFECQMNVSSSAFVLPSFSAKLAKVQTVLAVDFPSVKADDTLHVTNVIKLVCGIDPTNTAVPV